MTAASTADAAALADAQPRHIPERTCVACRQKRPQTEFVRVEKGGGGWTITLGRRRGRGAYICADQPACWQEKRLRRAFGQAAPAIAAQLALLQRDPVPA